MSEEAIILFDGICNLCNGAVNFIIDHDPRKKFKFAALQSQAAQNLSEKLGLKINTLKPDSIILIKGEKFYLSSTAALLISRELTGFWKSFYLLIIFPQPIRDQIYTWVAKNRYRWFGRQETCRLPTPELKERFI